MIKMINIKKILNLFYWVCIVLLILVAVSTIFSVFKGPSGLRILIVSSGSMEPNIKTGSVVLVIPQKEYKVGDVITFLTDAKANIKMPNSTFTHRITAIQNDEGRKTYKTKGDANKTEDPKDTAGNLVLGRAVLSIPFIGYIVAFTKTQLGFIALIIIPAVIIIYSELINIKKEALELIKKRRERKLSTEEKIREKIGEEVIAVEKEVKKVLPKKKKKKNE